MGEASSLRLQLEQRAQRVREGTEAAEQKVADLRERLRDSLGEAADLRNSICLLQSECNIATEDEQHARSMLDQAEAHLAEVEQSRRRDRERSEQLELQARRQRERELTELRRAEVAEATRMRSFLQQTLSTISAAATLDESPSRTRGGAGSLNISAEVASDAASLR